MARKLTTEEQMLFVQMLLESAWDVPKPDVEAGLDRQIPAKPTGDSALGWLEKWFSLPGAPEQ